MSQAIQIDSRFATTEDIAKVLGVSKRRTRELVKLLGHLKERIKPSSRPHQQVRFKTAFKKVRSSPASETRGNGASSRRVGSHGATVSRKRRTRARTSKKAR